VHYHSTTVSSQQSTLNAKTHLILDYGLEVKMGWRLPIRSQKSDAPVHSECTFRRNSRGVIVNHEKKKTGRNSRNLVLDNTDINVSLRREGKGEGKVTAGNYDPRNKSLKISKM
jgi:hypothetical protein